MELLLLAQGGGLPSCLPPFRFVHSSPGIPTQCAGPCDLAGSDFPLSLFRIGVPTLCSRG